MELIQFPTSEIMRPAQCYYITMPKTCVDVMWYMPETHRNPGNHPHFPRHVHRNGWSFHHHLYLINMASGDRHSDSMAGLYGCQDTREALKSNGPSPGLKDFAHPMMWDLVLLNFGHEIRVKSFGSSWRHLRRNLRHHDLGSVWVSGIFDCWLHHHFMTMFNGNSRILKWRYCTI